MTQKRILIVEDDDDFRKTLCERLKLVGYSISEARIIAQAETLSENNFFDAAVVDVRMKDESDEFDWSGLVLARTLGGLDIPVIILSSYDRKEDIERAYTVAPGVKAPYAFISKLDANYFEKLLIKLSELSNNPKGKNHWLKKNWTKIADTILVIIRKLFGKTP